MRSMVCGECGVEASKWVGQCPACGAWGSVGEAGVSRGPTALGAVSADGAAAAPTRIEELDRVLGGGLVAGSVTLLGGEPGIGKSTLLLQALAACARPSLLVCAEESPAQVRRRADRLGLDPAGISVVGATDLREIINALESTAPAICVVDSIQAISEPDSSSSAGSVTQVRDCASALARVAKATGMSLILVGHVTKDGSLAGPRTLEHLVDTVLSFEGDRHYALRLLSAVKHRFGPTGELGLFEMSDAGLRSIEDPSGLLLSDRRRGVPGSVVVPAVEGRRSLVVEVQALVVPNDRAGQRSARGIDSGRLSQILAVLEQRAGLRVTCADVFVSAVGGIRLIEPAADFGVALAIGSAVMGVAMPGRLVAFGEIGLAGEVRQVPHAAQRMAEAARLGFRQAFVPKATPAGPPDLELIRVDTLGDAVALMQRRRGQTSHPARARPLLTPVS